MSTFVTYFKIDFGIFLMRVFLCFFCDNSTRLPKRGYSKYNVGKNKRKKNSADSESHVINNVRP